MSLAALRWAMGAQAPDATAKLVLLVLADQHRANGGAVWECWPAVETIATAAQLSRTATRNALARLEAAGLIARTPTRGRVSSRYRLLSTGHEVDGSDIHSTPSTGHEVDGSGDPQPVTSWSQPVTSWSPTGHDVTPNQERTRKEPRAATANEQPRPQPPVVTAGADRYLDDHERAIGLAHLAELRSQLKSVTA